MAESDYIDMPYCDEDDGDELCPHCGKPYEDFGDIGCGFCDHRIPEWGTQ